MQKKRELPGIVPGNSDPVEHFDTVFSGADSCLDLVAHDVLDLLCLYMAAGRKQRCGAKKKEDLDSISGDMRDEIVGSFMRRVNLFSPDQKLS
jgi:hypothetical protein